jgi:8-oxo-dGTP diphosphatase
VPDGEVVSIVSVHAGSTVKTVVVTAAVIERDGCYLVTRRLAGTHLAGTWEFPGGKCDDTEPLTACMAREIREELGAGCTVSDEIFAITHEYPDRRIELHFFRVDLHGDPAPQIGQDMQWVPRERLSELEFPPADAELIRMLASRRA